MPGLTRIASAPARRPTTADRSSNPGRGPLYRPWSMAATIAFDPPSNSRASRISLPEVTETPPPRHGPVAPARAATPPDARLLSARFLHVCYAERVRCQGNRGALPRMNRADNGCGTRASGRTIAHSRSPQRPGRRPAARAPRPVTGRRRHRGGSSWVAPSERRLGLEPKADRAGGDPSGRGRRMWGLHGDDRTRHRGLDARRERRVDRARGQPVRGRGARHADAVAQLRHRGERAGHRRPRQGVRWPRTRT